MILRSPVCTFSAQSTSSKIKSWRYAAFDISCKLAPWPFVRRPICNNDILIDRKYASSCHSDIHPMKGCWGVQKYPQVSGHKIIGVVATVGKNLTRFKVGDRVGVGCMVNSTLPNTELINLKNVEQYSPATVFTYGFH
ncbi:alcohol dehydrogenase catalytic domain-containing protein [Pectobacterium brasiliense]|uniref:alcohol dehydrogenase catalytic domain-containing protein n=1 Tax=Pectobacterium brasiliense TaxID=180957 RepID=UPI004044821E